MEVDGVITKIYSKQSGKDDDKLRNHDSVHDKSTVVKPIGANLSRSRKRKPMSIFNLGSCINRLSTEEEYNTMKATFRLQSTLVTRNLVDNNSESQDELLPPRQGLSPQHGLTSHINKIVARGQLHLGSDDDQVTSAKKIGQDEAENIRNNIEYRDGDDGEQNSDGDGEEDDGVNGNGQDEVEDEGAKEGEVPEVKRRYRYNLRKHQYVHGKDVRRNEDDDGVGDDDEEDNEEEEVGDDEEVEQQKSRKRRNRTDSGNSVEVKQLARSPRIVLHRRMGTKANRDARKNGSRANNRHRVTQEEDSDDSLFLDEFDQGPPTPWSMGGTTALGLNVAASGWGHESDNLTSGIQTAGPSSKGGADIQPVQVDESVSFDEIGGLSEYIDALKEMVYFPLLYPDFFASYNITPPRGVLLCGPPGTGKTLIARALAGAASKAGQKVSFYMRKGADVLSKWVGESERQLKLLFEEAQRNQPSIIFFDEIDGLAPVRSSKQEQIHNSIVSTLLALMDGLDSRGQVVLIGATNRVDSIDGALRRPGRFDREFNFQLPGLEARAEILDIHTRKWKKPPSNKLKMELARCCVGYCGADLKALCTEAAIHAFREKYPQVYTCDDKFLIDVDSVNVERLHFTEAMVTITPAAHRGSIVHSRPLSSIVAPCLESQLQKAMNIVSDIFPFATQTKSTKLSHVYKPRLLLYGGEGVGLDHVGPALLHELETIPVHSLGLPSLLSDPGARTPEEALVHIFCEARRTTPSILYLPQFSFWWENAPEQVKAVLISLLEGLPSGLPMLLLGTSSVQLDDLPDKAFAVFSQRNIFSIEPPSPEDRSAFFASLIVTALSIDTEDVTPTSTGTKSLHELPKAPKVAHAPKASEIKAKAESQGHALRRMRMCLRDVCNRILNEKRFSAFHYPVMDEDEPNYRVVIQNPMDISTLLQRVDSGCYLTCKAFCKDLDLIWVNTKKYNGNDYKGARMLSKASELRDKVEEMLTQMDPALVSDCEKIAEEGGPVSVPEEFKDLVSPQTPVLAQMTTLTQSRAPSVHNYVQQEINRSDVLKKSKKKVDATRLDQGGLGNLQAECIQPEIPVMTWVSSSKDADDAMSKTDKLVETIKQQLMEHTKTYGIPELERLYGRIMKGAFETKQAAVMRKEQRLRSSKKKKIQRSSVLNFLLKLAEDETNFQCN